MIYTKTGAGIHYEGTDFAVGMRVCANNASNYAGLYGIIFEIRTDDDRETENNTPEIYCRFDAPVLPSEIKLLEKRFSALYRKPMTLDDISLDTVIMAPGMLEPSIDANCANPYSPIWAVIEDWVVDGERGHCEYLFVHPKDACSVFHSRLSSEAEEGCIPLWSYRDDFRLDHGENFYECWLDGDHVDNHYKLSLEQKPLVQGAAVKELLK